MENIWQKKMKSHGAKDPKDRFTFGFLERDSRFNKIIPSFPLILQPKRINQKTEPSIHATQKPDFYHQCITETCTHLN